MIYTFNAKGCILYPVMKSYFELSDDDVYKTIQDGFKLLLDQLAIKKISYDSLKRALVPNQDKDRFETCFVIDSAQIDRCDYGYYVFEKLIPFWIRRALIVFYVVIILIFHPNINRTPNCNFDMK